MMAASVLCPGSWSRCCLLTAELKLSPSTLEKAVGESLSGRDVRKPHTSTSRHYQIDRNVNALATTRWFMITNTLTVLRAALSLEVGDAEEHRWRQHRRSHGCGLLCRVRHFRILRVSRRMGYVTTLAAHLIMRTVARVMKCRLGDHVTARHEMR